jgi:hypothetical protein
MVILSALFGFLTIASPLVLAVLLVLTRSNLPRTLLALAVVALLGWLVGLPETLAFVQAVRGGGRLVPVALFLPDADLSLVVPAAGPLVTAAWALSLYDAAQQRRWLWAGAFVLFSMLSIAAYLEAKNAVEMAATTLAGLLLFYQGAVLALIVAMLMYAALALAASRPAGAPTSADG